MSRCNICPIDPYDLPANKSVDSYLLHPEQNWKRFTGVNETAARSIAANLVREIESRVLQARQQKLKGCRPCLWCEDYFVLRCEEQVDQDHQKEETRRGITWWQRYSEGQHQPVHPPEMTFDRYRQEIWRRQQPREYRRMPNTVSSERMEGMQEMLGNEETGPKDSDSRPM